MGVDITNSLHKDKKLQGVCDSYENFIWEPMLIRKNALIASVEVSACFDPFLTFLQAACTILSIDETVKNPKAAQEQIKKQHMQAAQAVGGRAGALAKNLKMR